MFLASVYVANMNLACIYAFTLCGMCLDGMCLGSMVCCRVHAVVLWWSEQISLCVGKQGKVREGIKKLSSYEALVMGLATLLEPLWVWPHSVGLTKLRWPGYTP